MSLIVFDLDGTLIDSRRDLADAANALVVERGGTPLSESAIGRMVGDGAAMLVRRAFAAAGLPLDERSLPRFLELYDARLLRTTRPYAGMIEALEALRGHGVLAVLTNKPSAPTHKLLAGLQLAPFFASIVGGDGPFPRKPDPHGLQHLMSHHGVTPEQTILIGDSDVDAATARAAGTMFCLARYGFGSESASIQSDVSVESPGAVPAAVMRCLAATLD